MEMRLSALAAGLVLALAVASPLAGQEGAAPPPDLLEITGTVTVSGADRFVAREHFVERLDSGAEVRISWLGADFKKRFLDKIEEHVDPAQLGVHRLRRAAPDTPIIAAIGERHETTLSHVWNALKQQPKGEPGALLTDSTPNVFFVRDARGVLWAVDLVWGGAGWEIGASAVDDRRPWRAGRQIISR